MQWKIEGAEKQTGKDRTLTIEAADKKGAEEVAAGLGLFVSSVVAVADVNSINPGPVPQRDTGNETDLPKQRSLKRPRILILLSGAALVVILFVVMAVTYFRPYRGLSETSFEVEMALGAGTERSLATRGEKEYLPISTAEAVKRIRAVIAGPATQPLPDRFLIKKYQARIESLLINLRMSGNHDGLLAANIEEPVRFSEKDGSLAMELAPIYSDTVFNTARLQSKQRAAAAFSEMVLRVLRDMDTAMNGSGVDCYCVCVSYGSKDLVDDNALESDDVVVAVVPAKAFHNFVEGRITDQELVKSSEVFMNDRDGGSRKIELAVQ